MILQHEGGFQDGQFDVLNMCLRGLWTEIETIEKRRDVRLTISRCAANNTGCNPMVRLTANNKSGIFLHLRCLDI